MLGGLLAAGGVAAHSGEAMAQPTAEQLELREERANKDIVWAKAYETQFDAAYEADDGEAMADEVRAFIREYRFPTQGEVTVSHDKNPMRVLSRDEWERVRVIALGFLARSSTWGPDHKALEVNLKDAIEGIDWHIDGERQSHIRHPAVTHSKRLYK